MIAAEKPSFESAQVNFFDMVPAMSEEEKAVLNSIKDLSINEMTPMEAMNQLYGLQSKLKDN